jgi:hypothetical protein
VKVAEEEKANPQAEEPIVGAEVVERLKSWCYV